MCESDIYDREIHDAMQVYSHSPSRQGKVTCVSTNNFMQLMSDLIETGASTIKLVILGHANTGVEKIAGWNCNTISTIIQDYTFIEQVTLFGCKSVQSNKLEEEKQIIRRVSSEKSIMEEQPCGLMIVRGDGLKPSKQLLHTSSLPAVFVIIQHQVEDKFSYSLRYISQDDNKINDTDTAFLTSDELSLLANNFTKRKGLDMIFPKKINICLLRNNKNPLKFNELELLNSFFSKDVFSRNNPLYKKIKQDYPFLRSICINETEANDKLSDSLLKKLVTVIKSNPEINREITVKGYSNLLHVDNTHFVFHVLPNMSYTHNYYKNRLFTIPNTDNIDRKNLSNARKKMLEEIQEGIEEGETLSKSIKVIINSPRC